MRAKTPPVVTCNEDKQEVIVTQTIGNKQIGKTFRFDKVWFVIDACLCRWKIEGVGTGCRGEG